MLAGVLEIIIRLLYGKRDFVIFQKSHQEHRMGSDIVQFRI
jgi:hypothetical protein